MFFNRCLSGRLEIFLTLNSCKTQFLLIGLRKKPDKKHTIPHSTPPTVLSASSLMNTLPVQTKCHLSPNPAIVTFINFAVSTLIPEQPVPLPLFTPNLTTVILFTSTSQSLFCYPSSATKISSLRITDCSFQYEPNPTPLTLYTLWTVSLHQPHPRVCPLAGRLWTAFKDRTFSPLLQRCLFFSTLIVVLEMDFLFRPL